MMLTIKSTWYQEFKVKPKNFTNRDMPFITDQFTSLAFIMHEIYQFGKFEIQQIQNENVSSSIMN